MAKTIKGLEQELRWRVSSYKDAVEELNKLQVEKMELVLNGQMQEVAWESVEGDIYYTEQYVIDGEGYDTLDEVIEKVFEPQISDCMSTIKNEIHEMEMTRYRIERLKKEGVVNA